MKIISIIVLMMGLLFIFTLSLDTQLYGYDLKKLINDWIRPFLIMGIAEKLIFFMYAFFILIRPALSLYKKIKQKGTTLN